MTGPLPSTEPSPGAGSAGPPAAPKVRPLRSVPGPGNEDPHGFLAQLSPPDRAALEALGTIRRYRPGRFVMLEGDRISHLLILREGRVKVTSTTPDGRELLLAVRGPGELIGELSALGDPDATCSAAVEAIDPLVAHVLPRNVFLDYIERHPAAFVVVARTIIERLKGADRRRMEFGSYDTPSRVARALVELAEKHGHPTAAGIEIGLSLSQEELAGLITASRESVARSLTALRRRGLVSTARRSIVVHDLDGLRRFAG
jgi:CRP/FNR family transcriptional regulator, cyclic AMP receptor protein